MQSEQRRKRKRFLSLKPPFFISPSFYYCFKCVTLFLFVALFIFFNGFPFGSPDLLITPLLSNPSVEGRVLFPDHVLLLISNTNNNNIKPFHSGLDCVYHTNSTVVALPVLSVDEYTDLQYIARCPFPPSNDSTVELRKHESVMRRRAAGAGDYVHSWEMLVYAAVIDAETVVVFVKGLNLRPNRVSDPAHFRCHFSWGNGNYAVATSAVTAAQEIVRCSLPVRLRKDPAKAQGVRVSVAVNANPRLRALIRSRRQGRTSGFDLPVPSVANMVNLNFEKQGRDRYELCVCTMLWNQARSLREWIMYHAWLGVERWFIYDNNSDDGIEDVIRELEEENYNITRHVWPWIKSQEAGFSHCILRARNECKWVAFMDVDEFFYFPAPTVQAKTSEVVYPGRNSLVSLVRNFSSLKRIGEIRTVCHSFGPSGLVSPPSQGVTVGYTCRLQSPERHKSIVRPDALNNTLLNVVHHFHLKRGYRYLNLAQNIAVINHYKYQVWEAFRSKFSRRVATYVTDWQENQNEGSKDRAPGLGTEAIEPPNWRLQFCQVWDTGLRDFVMANLAEPLSRVLPWENLTSNSFL